MMLKYLNKSFYRKYSPHYWPNLKLALPVVLSQAGQMVVGLADTIMVGQLGSTELLRYPLPIASLSLDWWSILVYPLPLPH